MAKQTRSGLGRGLNALIGGSMDEGILQQASYSRERTVIDARDIDLEKDDIAEVSDSDSEESSASDGLDAERFEKAALESPETPRVPEPESLGYSAQRNVFKQERTDDNIVIKGVIEREARPQVKNEPTNAQEVDIDEVEANPDQPRTMFKKEEIEELAASIEKNGLLQPILVRKVSSGYQIIAGERRWQACKHLGKKTIPIQIREVDDDKALELALIENIQRSDLNPIEEAYGYRRLMERRNMTQSEVAQTVSKGRSTIANALRLLELPEDAQQLLFEEKITAGHARAILSIPTAEGRQKLTDRMMRERISVREAEALARLLSGAPNSESAQKRVPTPKAFKTVARALRESLGTNVRVKTVQGKNKIEIEFKDEDELERLFENLTAFKRD